MISTLALTLLVLAFVICYAITTILLIKRKPTLLWTPATIIALCSIVFYWNVYGQTGVMSPLPRLIVSVRDSLNLFLFNMNSTFGRFVNFFYLLPGQSAATQESMMVEQHFILLSGLFLCSIWTTSLLIVYFLARRFSSRLILAWNTRTQSDKPVRLFLGSDPKAISVAKSMDKGERVVIVEFPEKEFIPNKMSLFQLLRSVRSYSDTSRSIQRQVPGSLVLKARKALANCSENHFFADMGLKDLEKWASLSNTCIFLLSDDKATNLDVMRKILTFPAQIYCHAKREGVTLRMELASDHIHILDNTFLGTQALKMRQDLYPVHVVNVAKDATGAPLGYVQSPFNALICGFGQAGQGVLSFLYEFGAFVGEDKNPIISHCEVIDAKMDALSGAYLVSHPGLNPARVHFRQEQTESTRFWQDLRESIQTLNFIFVGIGDDSHNLQLALDLLDFTYRFRTSRENFLILVKLNRPSAYKETIDFYNRNFGTEGCLRTIGDLDVIWTWDNISGRKYEGQAKTFYSAYARASADPTSWEERNRSILRKPGSELSNKMEIIRKIGQDFTNSFHMDVKAVLCPPRLWINPEVAAAIPSFPDGDIHYTGDKEADKEVLEYLAIGEHIRWNAAMEAEGYAPGSVKSEDRKTLPNIREYDFLTEEVKHYDWIVVKTTLETLRSRL
ncbi:MAG: hypothetical protein IKX62_00715 [Bacteroidales bacterium]|nr:hypothetical protein [Bacteroidales bacterium]